MVTGGHTPDRLARFMAKIAIDEQGCWIWTGARDRDGRGQFRWQAVGSPYGAHRWAYEQFRGSIEDGLHLDHLCNRGRDGCANPWHLEPVTQQENNRRQMERLGLDGNTCKRGHVGQFYRRPSGPRAGQVVCCTACRRERAAA